MQIPPVAPIQPQPIRMMNPVQPPINNYGEDVDMDMMIPKPVKQSSLGSMNMMIKPQK
jgi:hypothetical protein